MSLHDEMTESHRKDYEREHRLRETVRGLRAELDFLVAGGHGPGRVGVVQAAINQLANDAAQIVRRWD